MRQILSQRQIHFITWFLTGLMALVGLYSILPAGKESLVCAEERATEIEADGDEHDSRVFDWALDLPNINSSTAQTWHYDQVFFLRQPSQFELREHFGRGPPPC